jgi:hypothetical protein
MEPGSFLVKSLFIQRQTSAPHRMGKFEYFGLKISWVTFLYRRNQHAKFQESRRTLAKWVAIVLFRNPEM